MANKPLPSNTVHFVRYMAASGACSMCKLKHEHALMQFVQQSIVNARDENASHIQRLIQTMLMGTKNEENKLEQLIKNFANCCFLGMPLPEYKPARCRPDISVCDNLLFDVGGEIYENVYCDERFSVPGLEEAQKKNQTYSVNVVESITWAKQNMMHFTKTSDIEAQTKHKFGTEEDEQQPIQYEVQFFDDIAGDNLQKKYDQAFGYYKWIECFGGNVAHPNESDRMGIVIMEGTGKTDNKFKLANRDVRARLKKVKLNDDVSVYMTYDAAGSNLVQADEKKIGTVSGRQEAAAAIPGAGGGEDEELTSDFARMSLRGAGRGLGLRPQELAEVLELAS